MASTMTLARLQSGTYGSKQLADRLRRNLAKLDLDVYRDARFQHRECPACYYLRSERIAGQGFTDWRCSSCGAVVEHEPPALLQRLLRPARHVLPVRGRSGSGRAKEPEGAEEEDAMIGSIWAQTSLRVIGRDGKIPWRYAGDVRRFKRITTGAAVIMGRRTWESIGKPLPGRTNIVLTSTGIVHPTGDMPEGTELVELDLPRGRSQIAKAIDVARALDRESIWFIGGAAIYEAAMPFVDVIDITHVPDEVPVEGSVLAPEIDRSVFGAWARWPHEDDPSLQVQRFERRRIA